MDPTVVFDLVHVELSVGEFVELVRRGIEAFEKLADLARVGFCALPFVNC